MRFASHRASDDPIAGSTGAVIEGRGQVRRSRRGFRPGRGRPRRQPEGGDKSGPPAHIG